MNTLHHLAVKVSRVPVSDIPQEDAGEICSALRRLLADVFTLYVKTKSFHWHMSGRHFRDYHLLLDDHARKDCRRSQQK